MLCVSEIYSSDFAFQLSNPYSVVMIWGFLHGLVVINVILLAF